MGMLIDGAWHDKQAMPHDKKGKFVRKESAFRAWVTADGSSGYKAEPNRYHLYISYACPWACRALIFRKLKQLEDKISLSIVAPLMINHGWEFTEDTDCIPDTVNHCDYLHQVYTLADPNYTGRVTVPVLWDKKTNTIVNNESAEIIRMFNSEFNKLTGDTNDYYPAHLQKEIDKINEFVLVNVNNGVYRCGFATTQQAYEEAFDTLFDALDKLETLLAQQPYLVGQEITEADWRFFTTLVRFDAVYHGHFKCNRQRLVDYKNLSTYLEKLYYMPGIAETVNMQHIKQHYYGSHRTINPTGIVPKGPNLRFMQNDS